MRLRTQLVMFFGLGMGLIALALVTLTRQQTRTNLLGEIRSQMATGRYPSLEKDVLDQLSILSNRVLDNSALHEYHVPFISQRGPLAEAAAGGSAVEVMRRLWTARKDGREPWTHTDFDEDKANPRDRAMHRLWTSLMGLTGDIGPVLMDKSGGVFDFFGMTDREGRPLLILLTDSQDRPPPADRPLTEPKVVPALHDLIVGAMEGDPRDGYVQHVDGDIYLIHAVQFPTGGVMLLGCRIDQSLLERFNEASVTRLALVEREKVVGAASPELAAGLRGLVPPRQHVVEEVKVGANRFLLTATPLHTQLRPDKVPVTIGTVYELRSLNSVETYLGKMTEGIATVGIFSLLAGILGIHILSGRFTIPIERLALRMKKVGQGDLSQTMEPAGSFEVRQAGEAFNSMVGHLRQKEMLAKMVPRQAREAIAKADLVGGRVAGHRLKTTVLFSDIRGFTSLSEKLSPSEVMSLLDVYLARMTTIIEAQGGDVNEYIGDAILADFEDRPGDPGAGRACRAALAMTEALADLKSADLHPHLKELRQGLGLHTGELVKGEIGASDRSKFALIGDTVNLAARIQDRSRDGQHTCIFLSDCTRQEAGETFEFQLFGDEEFKGKTGRIRVWEIVGLAGR